MESKNLHQNISKLLKQRNALALLTSLLSLSIILLTGKLAVSDQKIIMVPALRNEMIISDKGVSKSYLEEMSMLFLSNLLDLTPHDIGYKKQLVLKNTSNNNETSLKNLIKYFGDEEQKHKKFDLSTFFSIKNLDLDLDNLIVVAEGIMTFHYGKRGHTIETAAYKLEFDYQGGILKLKSFTKLQEEPKQSIKEEINGSKISEEIDE